ncbi:MAG: ABC transporter substrate-binding protein [Anaerolineae bacterium]
MTRKSLFSVVFLTMMVALVVACAPAVPSGGVVATPVSSVVVNFAGVELLPDAAPAEQQVFRYAGIEGKHFDATKNIYESSSMQGYAWEPLVWLDADFNVYPGGAEAWETSEDGLTWTFHLRKNAKWSDGTPVTADDWVFSLRRMLDPETANPYGWFYYSIKNARPIHQGELQDVTQLGVEEVDDYTITITTEQPIPYLPLILGFIATIVPKHVVEEVGDAWASSPGTAVSNGPYMVSKWNKGKNVVFTLNPYYKGPHKGKVEKIILNIIPQTGAPTLQMYQADEIDLLGVSGADLIEALNDPKLKDQVDQFASAVTFYVFFNTDEPPFDDLRVRQAFSHAIDREAISQNVMQGLEIPAYSMLPPGFPCSQADDAEVQDIQAYDPELARRLLAEAGYPNGEGFPTLELWTRQRQIVTESEAIQRMLKDNLGVEVQPRDVERSFYMDKLRAHEITLGLIQWAQDYADPTNFLDWWATQSRHTWKNERFNELVDEARSELDPEKRCQLYHEAERILVEDVGAVFVGHPIQAVLFKPYVGGVRVSKQGARIPYRKLWTDMYIKRH